MKSTDFCCAISTDLVPPGRRCEWCGKLAEHQLTAMGGQHHNQGGFFCAGCGQEFALLVCAPLQPPLPIQRFEYPTFVSYALNG